MLPRERTAGHICRRQPERRRGRCLGLIRLDSRMSCRVSRSLAEREALHLRTDEWWQRERAEPRLLCRHRGRLRTDRIPRFRVQRKHLRHELRCPILARQDSALRVQWLLGARPRRAQRRAGNHRGIRIQQLHGPCGYRQLPPFLRQVHRPKRILQMYGHQDRLHRRGCDEHRLPRL